MTAYYNEIDPFAAQWLRNLIAAGQIARGEVDERSIVDVRADDLQGFDQCHFFAGIGVWSYALRLAGWPDDRPVWTGSCPCQPFSTAGRGEGLSDERHLWPEFYRLISQCQPPVIFGEQVASPAGLEWLDIVQADLERSGYAVGAADLCAAGVGAPHIRQRLWFIGMADAAPELDDRTGERGPKWGDEHSDGSDAGGLADAGGTRSQGRIGMPKCAAQCSSGADGVAGKPRPTDGHWQAADWLFCRDGKWRPVEPGTFPLAHGAPSRVGRLRAYGNAIVPQVAQQFISAIMKYKP